jgi:transposase-like protein
MNLSELSKKYNTKKKCIEFLEKKRWNKKPICPYCENGEHIVARVGEFRYHCNNCNKSFSVLIDTIFEGSNMPLPVWFQMVFLMCNSKYGISSMELARDLGITQKTAWFNAMKCRCAMVDEVDFIEGIIEMDETYIGGKPRKPNVKVPDNVPILNVVETKRGRGTHKIPVVGIVSRGKKSMVTTKVIEKLSTRNLLAMLKEHVNTHGTLLITDEFSSYKSFDKVIEHLTIEHQKHFSEGIINTNTIEGFWSIIKNGIKGNFRALSKKYLPFYLAEFSYKYNRRHLKDYGFDKTLETAVEEEKCLINYKPKGNVKKIVYGRTKRGKK